MKLHKRIPISTAILGLFLLLPFLLGCESAAPGETPVPFRPTPTATFAPVLIPPASVKSPEAEDTQAKATVARFAQTYKAINEAWNQFHKGYEAWRLGLTGCSEEEFRSDLRRWVTDFQPVVRGMTRLDVPPGSTSVVEPMSEAASTEEGGLRTLRDSWRPGEPTAFTAYENSRSQATKLRRQGLNRLADLLGISQQPASAERGTPEAPSTPTVSAAAPMATEKELKALATQLNGLAAQWDEFHQQYDRWRQRNGECDQAAVRAKLGGFISQFQELRGRIFSIERPSLVRPQVEMFTEAAVVEEQALKLLLKDWLPYNEGHWLRFETLRRQADALRHQVGSDLDQLRFRYGLTTE